MSIKKNIYNKTMTERALRSIYYSQTNDSRNSADSAMKFFFALPIFYFSFLLTDNCFGQDTLIKRDNGIKATISAAGFGIGYENEFLKKTYFDIGISSFPFVSGAYTQFKYAIKYKDKSKFKIGVGIQALYANDLYFPHSEFYLVPMGVMEYEYKGWGFGLGLFPNLFTNATKQERADLPIVPWPYFSKKFKLHRHNRK
jgi:hypothetical protein